MKNVVGFLFQHVYLMRSIRQVGVPCGRALYQ